MLDRAECRVNCAGPPSDPFYLVLTPPQAVQRLGRLSTTRQHMPLTKMCS